MTKLSLQLEKKNKSKAKAYSSSSLFQTFRPQCQFLLCRLPSSAGTGVVMTTPSLLVCAVTFSAAAPVVSTAPFVSPVDVTLVKPSRKRCRLDSPREKAKMLAAFEELWASDHSFSPHSDPSSAPQPPLVTPAVDVPAPVPPVVPVAVSVISAAASSACLSSLSRSAASSSQLRERLRSRHLPEPQLVTVRSPSVPSPAARGSQSPSHSQSRHPSGSWPPSSTCSASAHSRSTRLSSEQSRVTSRCSLSSR